MVVGSGLDNSSKKPIETAFSIETVFYALGLTSIILVGVIVALIYKTR